MDETLGTRVRRARKLLGISQRELSRRAGLGSERHVALIESGGRTEIEMTTARKLAATLGVSLDWLLGGITPEASPTPVDPSADQVA